MMVGRRDYDAHYAGNKVSAKYRELVLRLADDVLARATRTGDGLHWIHAEHRTQPDLVLAQTGLMQGAAGVGLLMLEVDAALHGRPPSAALPDSPFGAARQ